MSSFEKHHLVLEMLTYFLVTIAFCILAVAETQASSLNIPHFSFVIDRHDVLTVSPEQVSERPVYTREQRDTLTIPEGRSSYTHHTPLYFPAMDFNGMAINLSGVDMSPIVVEDAIVEPVIVIAHFNTPEGVVSEYVRPGVYDPFSRTEDAVYIHEPVLVDGATSFMLEIQLQTAPDAPVPFIDDIEVSYFTLNRPGPSGL